MVAIAMVFSRRGCVPELSTIPLPVERRGKPGVVAGSSLLPNEVCSANLTVVTTEPLSAGGDARELLSRSRELTQRVRRAQRATWFPLLVLAGVTFLAGPATRLTHRGLACRTIAGHGGPSGRVCAVYSTAGQVYWPLALTAAYVVIAAFSIRRARNRGVDTPVRPYVVAGIVIAIALAAAAVWGAHNPPVGERTLLGLHLGPQMFGLFFRLTGPFCAIGLGLLVLAWAERNRALLAFTVLYLAAVLVPFDLWLRVPPSTPWFTSPQQIVCGGLLLLAGLGFAVAQRDDRPPAS
jgi:hypothetical protein